MKPHHSSLRTSLLLAAAISAPASAAISSVSWSGATDANWATGTNWTGGVAPADDITSAIATFNLTTYPNQPDVGVTPRSVAGIQIGDGTTSTAALTVLGDQLTLGADGIDMKANAGAASLDVPITLGAAQTWRNNSANSLSSIVNLVGESTPFDNGGFLLTVDGSGPVSLGRTISGTGGLTKEGTNTLTLADAHTYTGVTTINAGTLEFGEGATGFTSAISNNATLKYNSSGAMTLGTVVSGTGALVKEGTGMLTLTAANTYSGATTVNNGTLRLQRGTSYVNTPGFTVNTGGNLNIFTNGATWAVPQKPISLSGGTLSYNANSGAGQYATGLGMVTVASPSAITVTAGSNGAPNASCFFLDGGLQGSADLSVTNNTNGIGLVLRAAGTYSGKLTVGGNASTTSGAGSGLTIGVAVGTPNLSGADLVINGTLELGGGGMGWANGAVAGTTVQIDALGGTGVVTSNAVTRTLSIGNNNGGDTFSGELANGTAASSLLSLIKNGNGTQILSGANTFSGTTTVNAGTLRLNHQNALANSTLALTGGATVFGSEVAGNAFTLGGLSGTGNLAVENSAAAPIALTIGSNNSDGIHTGQLSGAGTLEKIGTGALTLGGSNTLSGATTVSAGRLNVSGSLSTSDVSVAATGGIGGEGSAKSITINGGTLYVDASTVGALATVNGLTTTAPVTVTLSGAPSVLGPIALVQHGGSFTGNLSHFTFTGGSTRANSVTDVAGTIALDLGSANRTWGGADGTWQVAGAGTFWLEGDQKFYDTDFVTFPDPSGSKTVTLSGTLLPSSVTVTNTTGNNYTFSGGGVLTGTTGITKSGNGTLTVSGTHTLTGAVNVNGGLLTSAAASTASGSFLGGPGSAGARRTVNVATGATVSYTSTAANGFMNFGGAGAIAYGAFYDFNVTGTLSIYDQGTVSQILQSTYNLSNGGIIATNGTGHTGAYGLLFGWNGAGGGNINVTGTGNQITADRIGFFNGATVTTNPGAELTITSIVKNGNTTAAALTKAGTGKLTLTATGSSYTGATAVNAGTLLVNGTKTGAGAVTVATTGTLGGSGSIAGAVTVQSGGTLAPGADVGNLSFTSTVNLQTGSTYAAEIAGAASNDKIVATGAVTANGTVKVILVGGYVPASGAIFDLVDATITGTPAFDFTAATLPVGMSWDTTAFATNGTITVSGAPSDPFTTWATANNVTGGKNGDDDGDGVSNLLEFATAADPKNGSSGARVYPLVQSISGQKILTYTVAVRAAATFAANGSKQQADKDGVRYLVEGSDTLGTWNTVVVSELAPADATAVQAALGTKLNGLDAAWQWHSFRTDGDTASDSSDFIRLNVSEAP